MKTLFFAVLVACSLNLSGQLEIPEVYMQNKTLTYGEVVTYYKQLDRTYDNARLLTYGLTDVGKPLHLFVITHDQDFDPVSIGNKNKRIILISNGIHPGEPAGIEASLKFANDILENKNQLSKYLENTVICIIPVYNIGGALNRSGYHRANQDTPPECGFRGNSKNLNLNRDFMKCDSKNAKAFTVLFAEWRPDIFLETHTTDGSDHQYAITLITTQHNKLAEPLGSFMNEMFEPELFDEMKKGDYELIPYVSYVHSDPRQGFLQYSDIPRFSTGYGALHNTISFLTENHIFKPFKDRVLSCYDFITALVKLTSKYSNEIEAYRKKADKLVINSEKYSLHWKLDSTKFDNIEFKGYEFTRKMNDLTKQPFYFYDRELPYTEEVRYYKYYQPSLTIKKPVFYIIPQAWQRAIDRLKWNGVTLKKLTKDTVIKVEAYYIENIKTSTRLYEGHHFHTNFDTRSVNQEISFYEGDILVELNQLTNQYIMEALEPKAHDSFFRWNFFDPILEKKEYFSPLVFDVKAKEVLEEDEKLKTAFYEKQKSDSAFAARHYNQLRCIYENSPHYEKTHMRYPVYRINRKIKLPTTN